jgi:hypothetical protein
LDLNKQRFEDLLQQIQIIQNISGTKETGGEALGWK